MHAGDGERGRSLVRMGSNIRGVVEWWNLLWKGRSGVFADNPHILESRHIRMRSQFRIECLYTTPSRE